jgi:hypothetical protein
MRLPTKNPAPRRNSGLKRTWTEAIFKMNNMKKNFKIKNTPNPVA